MKKILAILIVLSMSFVAVQAVNAIETPTYCTPNPPEDCAWRDNFSLCDITTQVTIAGGTGTGADGNSPPVIKCKWEYDLNVSIDVDDCDVCSGCINGICVDPSGFFYHDACPCIPGLQVLPILGGAVRVGYFAVVYDPEFNIDHVYADIWHPDGEFKYQIELFPLDRLASLDAWDHVTDCHSSLIAINQAWASSISGDAWDDIEHELDQQLAHVYYGEASISYCQPGGYYTVGVRAHDSFNAWSEYLYNQFWYIPTTAIKKDFTLVNYGSAIISRDKWLSGDYDMGTPQFATIQNWGNTPVNLYVWQDAMGLGFTGEPSNPNWNVEYDVRLSADGVDYRYDPFENQDASHKGIFFGQLDLCTLEKIDFSIHVKKADPGTYNGNMCILAYRDGNPVWATPSNFVGDSPGQVVQDIYDPDPAQTGPGA
jgi:hypothetical protein